MPSESIAGFFSRAQASRVLFPEQIEQLIRQPDIPQANLDSLCEYLEQHGAITRFQSDSIRHGNGESLNFAGYPIIDDLGPCAGGKAYRALHPSLRTPIELRRYTAESLFPNDTTTAFLQRAQAAAAMHHPDLATLLDVGLAGGEVYVAIEPPKDSSPLDALVKDIGPMPSFLAAEYGKQTAEALRLAHERGLPHGDIRPQNLFVGPMTTKIGPDGAVKRRPAPNAAVKLAELGLVPNRPAAVLSAPPLEQLPYLPPERLENATLEPRGDLYSLGATLYFMLTGRAPHTGASAAELIQKVRSSEPAPLSSLRPDVPAGFAQIVHQLMRKRPDDRLATAYDVEQSVQAFCRPKPVPQAAPASGPIPIAVAYAEEEHIPTADPHQSSADEWGAGDSFTMADAPSEPRPKRQLSAKDKSRTKMLIVLGICMHVSAMLLVGALIFGWFEQTPEPEPAPPTKKEKPKKTRRHSMSHIAHSRSPIS